MNVSSVGSLTFMCEAVNQTFIHFIKIIGIRLYGAKMYKHKLDWLHAKLTLPCTVMLFEIESQLAGTFQQRKHIISPCTTTGAERTRERELSLSGFTQCMRKKSTKQ